MAKLQTRATIVGVDAREYMGKNGKTQIHTVHLAFDEENGMTTTLPMSCHADVFAKLKTLPKYCVGMATVALRSIKGNTYIDVTGFEPVKP